MPDEGDMADDPGLELSLVAVTRRFGTRVAVDGISLDVAAGSAVALMGPNGSGKTTLLRLMSGRDLPSDGQVLLGGQAFTEDDKSVRREVALVAEDSAFYPDLTVREHLWLVACAHGAAGAATTMVDRALADLRLADHAEGFPRELSSGQQQALLLATVLVRPRRLLLLDEPERRLDPEARQRLGLLLQAERAAGVTVVLATHHAELARSVADRLVMLRDGHVVADGSPADIDESLHDDD
jgi:ABC-type multidrug transport system ATPase subunit